MLRKLAGVAALLAFAIWRNGRVIKHNLLNRAPFDDGFFAAGEFSDCSPLANPKDPTYQSLKFCEDETFWDIRDESGKLEQRHLILSCDPNRRAWNTVMGPLRDPIPRGNLWLLTLDPYDEKAKPRLPVSITLSGYPSDHDFHPLGLEISQSHAGSSSNLFVINHARKRTTIEQFFLDPVEPSSAKYVRTLSSPYFVSPNAIALTSPTSFYVSNDHLLTRRLPFIFGHILPVVESLLALPFSWVSHVTLVPDSTDSSSEPALKHQLVAWGIPFANGISLSPDGSKLAVASTTLAQVLFYQRAPDNTLQLAHTVPLPFLVDNIAYDDSGALIAAGHPSFLALTSVAKNNEAVSPSWAVGIYPRSIAKTKSQAGPQSIYASSQEYDTQAPVSANRSAPAMLSHEVETLFQSNGVGFSSASSALRDVSSGNLYLAGLYAAEGAIVCRAKHVDTDQDDDEYDDYGLSDEEDTDERESQGKKATKAT